MTFFIFRSCSYFNVLVLPGLCSGKKSLLESSLLIPTSNHLLLTQPRPSSPWLLCSSLLLALPPWQAHLLLLSVWGSLWRECSSPDFHSSHAFTSFRSLSMWSCSISFPYPFYLKWDSHLSQHTPSFFPCCVILQNSNPHLTWIHLHLYLLIIVFPSVLNWVSLEAEQRGFKCILKECSSGKIFKEGSEAG